MPRRKLWIGLLVCLAGWIPLAARAHDLTITQLLASFDQPGMLTVKIDVDLSGFIGSPEDYYALSVASPAAQSQAVAKMLPDVLAGLQLEIGDQRLKLIFQGFALPHLVAADFDDPGVDKFTTLNFTTVLPEGSAPLHLAVPADSRVPFPIAFTVQIPSAHISETTFVEEGSNDSDPFDWANDAPKPGAAAAAVPPPAAGNAPAAGPTAMELTVERMPWNRQLWMYLRLGFHHIVPEGTDHILFVLGLFFLGITWRKLLFQTSVFTVAHATTLFLSTYGIFSLPSKYVEPAIALSIAFIALENVFNPKLGPGRLAVVFCFGLIHGLGFASSLSEVPFPKHQFLIALLGFNFGVDAGQLFIIGLAFLAVGWFRNRPWFRARIAIPCSCAIAAIGVFWAVQRIIFYSTLK
jgi:hypothetical protein